MKLWRIWWLKNFNLSHSARSAWIETEDGPGSQPTFPGRTPQGVRGLKLATYAMMKLGIESHSARSAWIETLDYRKELIALEVALRKECVD